MIEQISLTNVQKHKNLTLNLTEGVNVISGPTDTGKTAIFRGLIWALFNDGAPDRLMAHGTNKCSVSVVIDGNVIERSYSASANTYRLNDEVYKSFRTSVPADIASLINMDVISIQSRRDLPFMVYYKGSETAEQFSTMLDLNEIQTVTANTNRHVKQTQQELDSAVKKLHDTEIELGTYAEVDFAQDGVKELLQVQDEIEKCQQTLTLSTAILSKVQQAQRTMARKERYVDAEYELRHLELDTCTFDAVEYAYEKTQLLLKKYNTINKALIKYANTNEAEEELAGLMLVVNKINDAKTSYNKLASLCSQLKTCSSLVRDRKAILDGLEQQLHAYVGTICPTCGQVIGEV